jgi:N-acetylglucosaminyl-diphospho-decaprenol L-rhamnosyltransferase
VRNPTETKSKVVFVIVTWNRKKVLSQCLFSLKKYIQCPYNILVIDNASTDGTSEMVKKEYPEVILVKNNTNFGFGKANNQGIRYLIERNIPFDYVVFFNDDARIEDESFQALIDYMDENHDVKASIPSVYIDKGVLQTGVGGYELSLESAFNYSFFLSILLPSLFKGLFIHQKYFRNRGLILELDWISGVCLTLRSDLARFLRFPEDFFMYAEDMALCREIRNHGKIVYFPHSQIFHQRESYQSDKTPTLWIDSLFKYYRMQNSDKVLKKLWMLKIIFVFGFLLRSLGYAVLEIVSRNKDAKKREKLLYYSKYILNNLFRY